MRYSQIRSMDISNGEGVGVSLFVQGCPFHCFNCFNSETWDFNGGKEWTKETKNKFIELINRPYIKRVSFLGGECLADQNVEEIFPLIQAIRNTFPNKTIWLYTGYTVKLTQIPYVDVDNNYEITSRSAFAATQPSKDTKSNLIRNSIINSVDVLVDGEYIDEQRDITLAYRGSKNQRVIDVKQSLAQNKVVLYCD